jgi:Zn-dependent peptidase ImmA (M78 family)
MIDKYTPETVDYMFGGINQIDEEFRVIIAKAIANLPKKIVDWATERLVFISSCDDCCAFTLNLKEWKHLIGFIFLCEELRKEPEKTQTFMVAHEIAHRKLRHLSPILSNLSNEQTDAQEQEADDLALKWLSSEYETEWKRSLDLRNEVREKISQRL